MKAASMKREEDVIARKGESKRESRTCRHGKDKGEQEVTESFQLSMSGLQKSLMEVNHAITNIENYQDFSMEKSSTAGLDSPAREEMFFLSSVSTHGQRRGCGGGSMSIWMCAHITGSGFESSGIT